MGVPSERRPMTGRLVVDVVPTHKDRPIRRPGHAAVTGNGTLAP